MLKGILEGCILKVISEKEVYGYELATKLHESGFSTVSEGSIYPLLIRMNKEKLIEGTLKKSTAGPNRKYYRLTEKGQKELSQFIINWNILKCGVDKLLKEEEQ
ncbi:PadR family transcriptional regulator [Halalkalibacter flavus]|jgi:PadR family transcriptional regulator PadR|uniref:PadR family transcriptional regulator n=1 Tax=Halalkalibacter flavus TaxID=3090668 RepID=UPI002FC6F799